MALTFLLTDIEGSTQRWERHPDAMRAALARHDELLRRAVEHHGGRVFKSVGDGLWAVFGDPAAAVETALDAVRSIEATDWGEVGPLRIRVGLHLAPVEDVEQRDDDFLGPPLHRCARLTEIAHGGQILVSDTVRQSLEVATAEWRLRALGEHRLRDLREPEVIHQLVHPDLAREFPPLASVDAFPNNLPVQRTSFVGRESEVAELVSLVRDQRLVTLTGVGGAGKTRLALAVAAELLNRFPQGVWVVELAAVHDPELVPQALASALGLREQRGRELVDVVVDYVRDRQLLLLVDNAEHVIAACATLADRLLVSSPRLHLLTTSRERLDLPGEHVRQVGPLSAPEATEVSDSTSSDAVRLFLDRAASVAADLELSADSLHTVARICHRLDGIPLAIELAAARLAVLAPEEIEARLDDRFRLLTGGSRTAMPQHQTLRAAVDWSHDLLDETERTLFRRLGIFAGPVALDGIGQVVTDGRLEPDELLGSLTGLVTKSLVTTDRADGGTSYGMLQTVREYARERLERAGEAVRLSQAHADWVLDAARLLSRATREAPFATSAAVGASEHDVRAALNHLEAVDPQAALRLAVEVANVWFTEGRLGEGRRRLERTLALAGPDIPFGLRARALTWLAMLALSQGDLEVAETAAGEVAEAGGVFGTRVFCLWVLAVVAWARGDLVAPLAWHEQGIELAREIPYAYGEELHLIALSRVHRTRGELDRAEELLHAARAQQQAVDGEISTGPILDGRARVAYLRGDADQAGELALRARREYERVGYVEGITSTLTVEAAAALARQDLEESREALERALGLCQRMGHRGALASTLEVFAALVQAEGRPRDAGRLIGVVESIREELGERPEGDEPLVGPELRRRLPVALGDDFDPARAEGTELAPAEAIELTRRI